ncbi:MAG: divalent-cation tolerance protein CutA [Candidatus Bathyarchaeota archaeon]|nr:divalent-cation tolerance protein CutA [Candidatus Bathyarchaeota archaeon]MDH5733349.1 divalent-cation tolerance protein CutA [Candidatus Bathyarchaeota archaeon]
MAHHLVVFVTPSSKTEVTKVVRCLLAERLILCAKIIGPVSFIFWWKDKIEKVAEFLVLMKSNSELFDKLTKRVKAIHGYEVPEIFALPIHMSSPSYLNWLEDNLRLGSKNGG